VYCRATRFRAARLPCDRKAKLRTGECDYDANNQIPALPACNGGLTEHQVARARIPIGAQSKRSPLCGEGQHVTRRVAKRSEPGLGISRTETSFTPRSEAYGAGVPEGRWAKEGRQPEYGNSP